MKKPSPPNIPNGFTSPILIGILGSILPLPVPVFALGGTKGGVFPSNGGNKILLLIVLS